MNETTTNSLFYQKLETSSPKGYSQMTDVYSNCDAIICCGSCESNKNLTCSNFASPSLYCVTNIKLYNIRNLKKSLNIWQKSQLVLKFSMFCAILNKYEK